MKKVTAVIALILVIAVLLPACTPPNTGDSDTGTGAVPSDTAENAADPDTSASAQTGTETDSAIVTDVETAPESETDTEPETEPATQPPEPRTVSFINSVGEVIPSVTVPEGEGLKLTDIVLPEGTSFKDGNAVVYPIGAGQTFDGDFSHYTPVKAEDFTVTEDVVLALDLTLETRVLTSLADTSVINYYGRNYIEEDKVTFLNTASGFEVRFYGRKLTANFTRRGPGPYDGGIVSTPTLLRIRVYTDGDMSIEGSRVIVLDHSTDKVNVVLAEFDEVGYHTVLVRKMNYDWWGYLELRSLETDGGFCRAPAMPEKKILVYGDSITVGFGVEYAARGDVGGDCPEKEDGTVTYSAKLADYYGAQLVEYCNSGVSIGIPCWRDHVIMRDGYWKQYAYFDTGSEYDMSLYVPDLIICNLGTNDNGGLANGVSSFGNGTPGVPNDTYTAKQLEEAYAAFISTMKELYPDAVIIMTYGMMGTGTAVSNAISRAVKNSGFHDVYFLNFAMVECSENAGHPTVKGQAAAYEELLRFIKRKHIEF